MIAYRASDVKLSWQHNHPVGEMGAPKTCGYVKEPLDIEGSTDNDDDDDQEDDNDDNVHVLESTEGESNSKWSKTANIISDDSTIESKSMKKKKNRVKRQSDQYEYTPTKTRCPLLLVADYRFFQEMGGGNTKTTINYLVRDFE